ncbi:complement component C7-like [Limanda limanda]|uniref:complement component C7-like n=1 Tax=Limanda limanda TaxID=27771 RepID=UPI0029C8188D|nr:complement component C7-like [Limanda limanda]
MKFYLAAASLASFLVFLSPAWTMETCGPPPNLRNGFIQNPKDLYRVGSTVDFSCIEGFKLSGHAAARCNEDKTWTQGTWVCIRSRCLFPQLSRDVVGTPTKVSYRIGETVSLHCPTGSLLDAEVSEVMCSPLLQWSPSPAGIRCKAAPTAPTPPAGLKCKPWEKVGTTGCVCKMPSECKTSLPLCARFVSTQTPRFISLCQLGALRCIGRSFALNADTDCRWPHPSCRDCPPGTVCHSESAGGLIMKDKSGPDCPRDSAPVCVSSDVATTMTECEVGARRCAGERLNVTGIDSCPK